MVFHFSIYQKPNFSWHLWEAETKRKFNILPLACELVEMEKTKVAYKKVKVHRVWEWEKVKKRNRKGRKEKKEILKDFLSLFWSWLSYLEILRNACAFCILCFLVEFFILLNELKGKKGFFWTIVGTCDDHDSVLPCLLSWHFVFRGIFHVCIISTKKQVFFALFFSFFVQEKIAQSLVKNNKTLKGEVLKLKRKLRGEIKRNSPAVVEGDF